MDIFDLETSTIWNIIFLVLAVAALLWAFYSHYSSKPKKIPYYHISHFNIISDTIKGKLASFEIKHKGNTVLTLSVTKIVIWNGGNTPIRKEDIAKNIPFVINFGSNIFEAKVINQSSYKFDAEVEFIDDFNLKINFDFIDANEGFVIEVTNSVLNGKDIYLEGGVIGGKNLSNYVINNEKDHKYYDNLTFIIIGISMALFVLMSYYFKGIIIFLPMIIGMTIVVLIMTRVLSIPYKFRELLDDSGK